MNTHLNAKAAGLFTVSLTLFFLCCAGPAPAQKTTTRNIDPKAQRLLKQSAAVYQALHSFSCRIQTELTLDSVPRSRIIKIKMAFQRPAQAAVTVDKAGEMRQYLSDGKNLYLYLPAKKEYTQDKLPPNDLPAAPVLMQGQSFTGLLLLKPSGLSALSEAAGAKSLTLGPVETLDGTKVRTVTRVLSGRDGGQMTFYVTIGIKDHLVYRFADTIQSPKPLPMGMGTGNVRRIDNREICTEIQIDPVLPKAAFLPTQGAKKVETNPH